MIFYVRVGVNSSTVHFEGLVMTELIKKHKGMGLFKVVTFATSLRQ